MEDNAANSINHCKKQVATGTLPVTAKQFKRGILTFFFFLFNKEKSALNILEVIGILSHK